MSPRRQARSHGAEQTYEHIAATGFGSRRQDVALLEPALGGEVQVAAAVGPDRAGFLALDVALEPGGVDRLDEEFLGGVDGQADVPFPCARRGARGKPDKGDDRPESTTGLRRAAKTERVRRPASSAFSG